MNLFWLFLLVVPVSVAEAQSGSWDTIITKNRFRVLTDFNSAAVVDKETGLVWEQSPDTTLRNWFSAQAFCNDKSVRNRKGWRVPTIQELASLIDPEQQDPALSTGYPFSNVQLDRGYWSATTTAGIFPEAAWVGGFAGSGGVSGGAQKNLVGGYVWCVRSGSGVETQ